MAAFHEVLFPADISYGSAGGPKFKTTIFTADSGYEQRNVDWQKVRCEYNASQAIKTVEQMTQLTQFFMARFGRAYGFRFKDWNDFQLSNQTIGAGDGTTTVFQIVKTYVSSQTESGQTWTYTRPITKINWDTIAGVTVGGDVVVENPGPDYPDGANYYGIDETTGLMTFRFAPQGPLDADGVLIPPGSDTTVVTPAQLVIIGLGEFHVPVRFDVDQLDITQEYFETSSWPDIKMIEVRDWTEVVPT